MRNEKRALVRDFFEQLAQGTLDHVAQDAFIWTAGRPPLFGQISRMALAKLLSDLCAERAGSIEIEPSIILAEGNSLTALAESHVRLRDGGLLHNFHHVRFEVKESKITSIRNYCDTARINDAVTKLAFI